MKLKWEMLFQDLIHIFACYLALWLGSHVADEEPGFKVYEWRGKRYVI